MEKILSKNFYQNIEQLVMPRINNDLNKLQFENIDWEKEAAKCLSSLKKFFESINVEKLNDNGIDKIGVVDICWNEYGSTIEVDFMPDNNFETAFDEGCIMNDSAISNEEFFRTYFEVDAEKAWEKLEGDYLEVITSFCCLIKDIIGTVADQDEFKALPKHSPYHVGVAGFHDEQREIILTKE